MTSPRLDGTSVGYQEWLGWPETTVPVEVIDGQAVVSPTPATGHQRVVSRLLTLLASAAPSELEVLPGPVDWVLRREPLLVRQPDLVVIEAVAEPPPRLSQPPLVAVEVVSGTSRERDLVHKRGEYATAGLTWYWLVDTDVPQVLVLRNRAGAFEEEATAVGEQRLEVTAPFPVALRPAEFV